jgi:hypothetical protein
MTKNEIKKLLYKQKPVAFLQYIRKGNACYESIIEDRIIWFEVPVSDMGDADFWPEMQGQLLIRWIKETGN